ncbi:Mu-like prophage major head subunit gpT family protein [Azospirillum halopraeferens]|uniref:Mu-like prophage major head subunit gpT family protein n=1 Tax=Azospirillum halopraeferens TaxID=34010 RepID=UPI0003F5B842|nr:Mu-like prophage major head subunit gpT family protein [Azospirillum halopraeferens]
MRVITAALLASASQGFQMAFNTGVEAVERTWPKIAMETPSYGRSEIYPWLMSLPGTREWIGERFINSLEATGFEVVNRTFENTYGVKRTDIEDDRLGIYRPAFAMLGESAAETPDELVWGLLPAGFSTMSWDGQYFFDADHPVMDRDGRVTSMSNFGGGTGTPWYLVCTKRVRKPFIFQKRTEVEFVRQDQPSDETVFMRDEFLYGVRLRCSAAYGFWQMVYASRQPLNSTTFDAAYAAMCAIKGDYGRPLNNKPNLLVVPTNLRGAANEVIKAERLANGATNTNRDLVEIHVEQRL